MLLSCHLNIPGEFSLGAVCADWLSEVSLGVPPGVGRSHLYGHHPCHVTNQHPIINMETQSKRFFGGKSNNSSSWLSSQREYACHCLLMKILYLSLSFVIFHSSQGAPLSVFWNNSTNHLIIFEEFLFYKRGGLCWGQGGWCQKRIVTRWRHAQGCGSVTTLNLSLR